MTEIIHSNFANMPYCIACLRDNLNFCSDTAESTGIIEIYKTLICDEINRLPEGSVIQFCNGCETELKNMLDFKMTCLNSINLLEQRIPDIRIDLIDFSVLKSNLDDLDYGEIEFKVSILENETSVDEIVCENLKSMDELMVTVDENVTSTESETIAEEVFLEKEEKIEEVPNKKIISKKRKSSRKPRPKMKELCKDIRNICNICSKSFEKITIHAIEIHSSKTIDNQLKCINCDKTYSNREKFIEHFDRHRDYVSPKKCLICDAVFKKRPEYDRHMTTHKIKKPPVRKYVCDKCFKEFSNTTLVKYHKIKDHEGGFQCKYCPMAFSKDEKEKYDDHMEKEETRKQKRPSKQGQICDFCGHKTSDSSSLYEHIRKYHNNESFTCNECGKSFLSKFSFKNHYDGVHGESKYQCPDCGKQFKLKNGLKIHSLTHAPSEPCKKCGKKLSPRYMAYHMKLHSEEQNHICGICGAAFKTQALLLRHKHQHNESIPYNCQLCDAGYYMIDYLRYHYLKNHGFKYSIKELEDICAMFETTTGNYSI